MAKLNKTDFQIRFKKGLRANLGVVANYFAEGEPIYLTDSKQLFIADASYVPQPVATLDMAVVNDGEIVTNNGEIVYSY